MSPSRRKAEEDLAARRSRLTLRQRQQGGAEGTEDLPPLTLGDTAFVPVNTHPCVPSLPKREALPL
jgi:hypothetical protein